MIHSKILLPDSTSSTWRVCFLCRLSSFHPSMAWQPSRRHLLLSSPTFKDGKQSLKSCILSNKYGVNISRLPVTGEVIVSGNHTPNHKSISSSEIIFYLVLGTQGDTSEEFINSCIACFRGNQLIFKLLRRCFSCC